MYRLSSIIIAFGFLLNVQGQSPHGEDFKMNCAACHTPDGWEIPAETWEYQDPYNPSDLDKTGVARDSGFFNHDIDTNFPLLGGHASTDCRLCHEDLVFTKEQNMECVSCHTDIHRMTVGSDCARCHTVDHWLVDDVTDLHQDEGFPLLGRHALISCNDCHISETGLEFNRLGNDCLNCHLEDYMTAMEPNHVMANFSTNCVDCHDVSGFDWSSENIIHDFFPLEKGHDIADCSQCHVNPDFSNTPTECFACHQMDFEAAINPNHQALNFSTDCAACHTLDINWMPAEYTQHDADFFPIYSGTHQGEWETCTDCHLNPANYAEFTCTTCHEKNETDDEHNDVSGYVYESGACLACHPTGSEEDSFDHNRTNFPLTGAHIGVDCNSCHANGFAGTPTDCAACHTMDFEQTTSPDHEQLNFSTDCASCHTTDPNWMPATFAEHDNYFVLRGAHTTVDCAGCHNSTFTNTPTTCFGCHESDYNNANNPNHASAGFSTDCASCHNEDAWTPADFDHDGDYFPIYSGTHQGEWNDCRDCHIQPGNYAIFSCIDCHEHNDPNDLADEHNDVNGYEYLSTKCLECHPNGD